MAELEIPGVQMLRMDPVQTAFYAGLQELLKTLVVVEKLLEVRLRADLGVDLREAVDQVGLALKGLTEPAEGSSPAVNEAAERLSKWERIAGDGQ